MAIKKVNLDETFGRRSYQHAILLTYNFGVRFFEDYCLEKYRALANNGNVSVLVDRAQYERVISGPEPERPKKANLRYLLQPVSARGAFHPKVFLFATKSEGLLVIGSANLTREGITSNAELVGVFEFELGKDESYGALFGQAFQYISALAERSPSENLRSNLNEVAADSPWLLTERDDVGLPARLAHNLKTPLWGELRLDEPVEEVHVLSRFFDPSPGLLSKLLDETKPAKCHIYTQDGITTLTPDWVRHPAVKSGQVSINLCSYSDEEHNQPLHAKAIALVGKKSTRLVFGSANFTSPALLHTPDGGNAECVLVLSGPRVAGLQAVFDPSGNASLLKDPNDLQFERQEREYPPTNPIQLEEVVLEESTITCKATIPTGIKWDKANLHLEFSDGAKQEVDLVSPGPERFKGEVGAGARARLDQASTRSRLAISLQGKVVATSNVILVSNLQELETGHSLRRERLVREAQAGAAQFSSVLSSLLQSGDEDAFLKFLIYCDIPFLGASPPRPVRPGRAAWEALPFMRQLRERSLSSSTDLHQAALGFIDHHMKKLVRHAKNPSRTGLPNFMHIALAIAGVALSEVDRVVAWTAEQTTRLSIDDWYRVRERLDRYLQRLYDVSELFGESLLPSLLDNYSRRDIRESLLPDAPDLVSVFGRVLASLDRLHELANKTLRLESPHDGSPVVPPFGPNNLCRPERWPGLKSKIESGLAFLTALTEEKSGTRGRTRKK